MSVFGIGGTVLKTSDGEAIVAGVPVRVFMMHIISTGGGAAIVSLKNNGASGTTYITETGTLGTGKTFTYGRCGILFPNGCYVDVDVNTTSATLTAIKEL